MHVPVMRPRRRLALVPRPVRWQLGAPSKVETSQVPRTRVWPPQNGRFPFGLPSRPPPKQVFPSRKTSHTQARASVPSFFRGLVGAFTLTLCISLPLSKRALFWRGWDACCIARLDDPRKWLQTNTTCHRWVSGKSRQRGFRNSLPWYLAAKRHRL